MKRFSEKYIITKKMEWEVLGVNGSEVTLFWGGFGIIKIKYRLNNPTFRYSYF
tara:strand:- start:380 stop:538 length:159 start_codon:yes stop_codon:yes gene_type:complete